MADADVVSCCLHAFCALFVADLIVGMEELELHYRRIGRSNFQIIKIATISVRMVSNRINRMVNQALPSAFSR